MERKFLVISALSGSIAVAFGAMGAHLLKGKIDNYSLQVFETGVRYQMYHSLALLMVVLLMDKLKSKQLLFSGYAFIVGILLFSGSLYLLSLRSLIIGMENIVWIGAVTPLGGVAFIIGWIFLLISALKSKSTPN